MWQNTVQKKDEIVVGKCIAVIYTVKMHYWGVLYMQYSHSVIKVVRIFLSEVRQ